MAPTPQTGVPATARVGDTLQFYVSFADYPASEGWVVSLAMTSRTSTTQAPLAWDAAYAATDGDRWLVTIPTTATDDLSAGSYDWTAFVTGTGDYAGQRFSPASGRIQFEADAATAGAGDDVAWAEEMLPIVEAEIKARITGDGSAHEGYAVGGRSISKLSLKELREFRASLIATVQRSRTPSKLGRRVEVTFKSAESPDLAPGLNWAGG